MKQCAASLRLHNAHVRRDSSPCTAEACATISRSHRRAAGLRSPFLQGQQALNCCRRFSLSCQELCSVSGLWLSHGGTQRELESKVGRQRTQLKDMGTSDMHISILVQAGWRRLAVPPQTACVKHIVVRQPQRQLLITSTNLCPGTGSSACSCNQLLSTRAPWLQKRDLAIFQPRKQALRAISHWAQQSVCACALYPRHNRAPSSAHAAAPLHDLLGSGTGVNSCGKSMH